MQLDSLMICHLVNELNQQLIGAQIREIHQTDDRMFEIELFRADAKPMHLPVSYTHLDVYKRQGISDIINGLTD